MEKIVVISVIGSAGLGISSFFGVFLLRKPSLTNKLLAFLLIALSIRITKSVFYSSVELPLFIRNIGIAANLAIGPLLFFYTRSVCDLRKIKLWEFLHFIPSIIYLALCNILLNGGNSMLWTVNYSLIMAQSFIYVIFSLLILTRSKHKIRDSQFKWLVGLSLGLSFMWLIYALNFLGLIPIYALGPITFSILMFCLLAVALKNKEVFFFRSAPLYSSSRITEEEANAYLNKLHQLMKHKELYKNPDLTVAELSSTLGVSKRNVSLILNKHDNCNFSRFVNNYRVEEAKELIKNQPESKMIAVAYESGFNNLATFNQAFKSYTGQTPTSFKQNLLTAIK
ncbi:MAG: helix-turn-helix transcriptional regulator [Bacteroidota bacterium]